ncbi:MAG: stage II sporulation protein M [Rhodopirellula sp.]|nr:stage II sporulation protein M [Rhodopirellula sp.]
MTRDQFITKRRPDWRRFELLLAEVEGRRTRSLSGEQIAELSSLYRAMCFDLSLIQSRDWGTSMSRYLNSLVSRGHNCLYRSQPGSWRAILEFVVSEFPRLLRANGWYFALALALFVIPGTISGTVVALDPSQAGRIMPGKHQSTFEDMYSKGIGEGSSSMDEGRAAMAGFYVHNNVGIAFKCFALGSFAGIGTMVVLIYNSIFLGTVTGFLVGRGHSHNFFEFVVGHGSFELTAIVVSGAAGLVLGHAIVHPGRQTRRDALRERGLVSVKLALGAGFMLCLAAIIEAFWSPSQVSFSIKMVVGAALWIVVVLYLSLAGRTRQVDADFDPQEAAR